jgi:hypothetical protein
MSTFMLLVGGFGALALLAPLAIAAHAFLHATVGAKGLKARIQRLFLPPVRVHPLPRSHYFKAYWRGER